jgi:hypothetical protein
MRPVLDTRALAEASRNLTQTLKQLSSEVLTSRSTNVNDFAPFELAKMATELTFFLF